MSELIDNCMARAGLQKQLLTTVSALALASYIGTTGIARAEDAERPSVWLELGGQMEAVQGVSTPFTAPFMSANSPTPGPYANKIFTDTQRPAHLAFGLDGSATFQPKGSDWLFSVGVRYGRSGTNRHSHQQSPHVTHAYLINFGAGGAASAAAFADTKLDYDESHMILDFTAGRDVGLGVFGREGISTISAGVRFAQFSNASKVTAIGRPEVDVGLVGYRRYATSFYNYTMFAQAARSFHGIGPSLSWNASTTLLGNKDAGRLTFDWGINGAVLFGRQKAKATHSTQEYHLPLTQAYGGIYDRYYYTRVYRTSHPHTRSRSVTVPNLGGFAGLSVRYPNAKFSLGYRADFFFGAVDAGIDEQHVKNLGFNGPYASISIGLGG